MTSSSRGPDNNLTLFAFLIAFGTIIHKTQLWEGLSSPLPIMTTGLAVALLFRPGSPRILLAFAVATLAEATWYAPFYFLNHMIYVAFVAVGIIGVTVTHYLQKREEPTSLADLEPHLFPLLRAGFYAMFAFVVLHKLNADFFDPSHSCAVEHWGRLERRLPFVPAAGSGRWSAAIPFLAIGTEASIPLLIFFRRTRQFGFLVAAVFHYVMAINGFQGFSAYAFAMYVPFVPRGFHRSVAVLMEETREWFLTKLLRWGVPVTLAIFALAITLAHAADRTYQMQRMGYAMYLLSAPPIYFLYFWLSRSDRFALLPRTWPSGVPRMAWQWVLLALLAIQSASPYLGFKTQAVFSMYSNLQTEGQYWNHLFLPESLRFGGFQEVVTVSEVRGMTLLRPWERDYLPAVVRANEGEAHITLFALKRQIAAHCRAGQSPIMLEYRTANGRLRRLEDACADEELSSGNGWFLEKIFWFRPVELQNKPCIH